MAVCKRVIFRGLVQGVGFRMTTRRLAEGFAVAGFVRNLDDGSVEVVAEGEPEEVAAFLDAVTARMANYLEDRNSTEETVQGLHGFNIRY
jgi:acylphosphatase